MTERGTTQKWSPSSWRSKPVQQVPAFPDAAALAAVEEQLAGFPPLVLPARRASSKRRSRKSLLVKRSCFKAAIALESFAEHSADNIRDFSASSCRWRWC